MNGGGERRRRHQTAPANGVKVPNGAMAKPSSYDASFMKWTVADAVHVATHHWMPCLFALGLLFFMAVEYTLRMVPPSSPPFDLGFLATRSLHALLESSPHLNTLFAALNTGNPIDWVSTHRYHHQFCDSERDPHSPTEGFWFSHMSWLFDSNSVIERCGEANNVGDLEKQSFYRFLRSTYLVHPFALGALLYAAGGFPFLVWGMGVRIVWVYHITWFVNSACHVWGNQAWNTRDLSRNNWWVALLAFGEGWHNNHHAFEYSARHGLEWWQLDMTWYVVRFLQAIGLATDVKLPTESHKQKMAFNSDAIAT